MHIPLYLWVTSKILSIQSTVFSKDTQRVVRAKRLGEVGLDAIRARPAKYPNFRYAWMRKSYRPLKGFADLNNSKTMPV